MTDNPAAGAGTYAPQSPDLSSFYSTAAARPDATQTSSAVYAPKSPVLPPTFTSHPQPPPPYVDTSSVAVHLAQPATWDAGHLPSTAPHPPYMPPIPPLPTQHQYQLPGYQPSPPQFASYAGPEGVFQPHGAPDDPSTMVGRRSVKPDAGDENGAAMAVPGLGPSQGVEVKTKFPVARIKRIMQADEEVGKVAQVTPVAVSKALELFMISLVLKSSTVAKAKGSKRITAHHLKNAIEADEQFDFLSEIVAKIADAPESKKESRERIKSDDDSDDGAVKKRRGRRKKSEE